MHKLLADYAKKPVVPTGVVNGVMGVNSDDEYSSSESEQDDCETENYEQDYVLQEMKKYASIATDVKTHRYDNDCDGMSEVDGAEDLDSRSVLDVYNTYNFNKTFVKRELPIDSVREKIIHLVDINNVVIIQGQTGCGKTTQVPQYILDACRERQEYCNIAVTQPRKIATITVARRVCEERGWALGTVCGYQVGLEKKVSRDMLLTYMTTGVLLQKIIMAKSLRQFTHIIIDEVHERNQDLDFLLLIVRRFLFTNSPSTKVILMSATIDAEEFAYYFRCQNVATTLPAPIIYVNKESKYKHTEFYLEQLGKALEVTRTEVPSFDIDRPEIPDSMWKIFTYLVSITDKVDTVNPITNKPMIGSILVFLPGINEIEEAHKRLINHFRETRSTETQNAESVGSDGTVEKKEAPKIKWEIIPLHSSLPNDEQAKAFKPARPGHRKIILSTNIAESSITVPDTYYVIDFCQTKVMTVDPVTKYMSLKLEWASHVNCQQRAGRVGRIADGRVYRLVPMKFYNEKMARRSIPEIIRAPLERVVLQSKMLNLNDTPQQILALALNPPNLKNIENTILFLKEIGGLLRTCKGRICSSDGDITFLGTVMASLPVDVHLSKLIVLGHLYSCLEEAVIIAAGCSIQNIFSIPFQQRFNAYKRLLMWADGSSSDLIALLNLYRVWQSCRRDNKFENIASEYRWCQLNLVSLKGLREWNLLVTEIKQRLDFMRITETVGPGKITLDDVERPLVLKIITAGAFYPNFFLRTPDTERLDEREAVKMVGGRDPFKTVYMTGMDPTQPVPLYVRAIKKLFRNEGESESDFVVGYDGSSKLYLEFKNFNMMKEQVSVNLQGRQQIANTIAGRIPMAVYEAIRKRQLKYNFDLKVLPAKEAWEWAERNGIDRNKPLRSLPAPSTNQEINCFSEYACPIPSLDTTWITIKITEYIDAAHFWANNLESEALLGKIEHHLNKVVLHRAIKPKEQINMGKLYAAKYHEDNLFYRCKVISHGPDMAQVLFIDYGNIQQVAPKDLYELPDYPECLLPALGLECILHGIQPSRKVTNKGYWTEVVNQYWKTQTAGVLLYGKVHSVVDDVVYLELFKSKGRQVKSINEQMILQRDAEPAAESFLSKADHEKRLQVQNAANPQFEATRMSFDKVVNYQDFEAPPIGSQNKVVHLKGPFSPVEMKIFGCIESASNKTVDIEGNSVNTVLLDSEPQDYQSRLLVSGYVGQSASGDLLKLRQTTLMPSIPGFPMLLALLFCPTMQVKLSQDGSRVASVLCGLGYNQYTNKAIYPSHDLPLILDTELGEEEINKINQVRFYMNQGIKLMNEISQETSRQDEMITSQTCLKEELMDLVYIPRKPQERLNVKYANVWGKTNVDAVVLKPNMSDDTEDIWPLLWFVKLNKLENYNPDVFKNLDDLDLVARNMIKLNEIECFLCKKLLNTVYEVRYHLMSSTHKEAVKEYHESVRQLNYDSDDPF